MSGTPVYITANNGSPVNITGAGAGSIPISGIAAPVGSVPDQQLIVGPTSNLIAAPGFFSSVLISSALPFVMAPTGTMGNNGAITMGTALEFTYPNCYVALPAGAIATGIPAASAWYYCVMSSSTVGTVYNNTYGSGSGQPTIPASPTPFVATGPGAFTGITSGSFRMQSYSLPAGTLGIRDSLRVCARYSNNNTSGNKTLATVFGANILGIFVGSSIKSVSITTIISNREATNSQIGVVNTSNGFGGTSTSDYSVSTIDTTMAALLEIACTRATATDTIVAESFMVELLKGS